MSDVLIVGAGVAGLTLARALGAAGVGSVVVLDKGRGAGGRASRRRIGEAVFHHGAPFDARWDPRALAEGVEVRLRAEVASLRAGVARDAGGAELGRGQTVVVTAPAPQAAVLLRDVAPGLAARAASVAFDPVWAVMGFGEGPAGATLQPGGPARWVLRADVAWSREHVEDAPVDVAGALAPGLGATAHRWRFALPAAPLSVLFLREGDVAVCGDWCGGSSLEAAAASGAALAAALLG